MRALMVTLLVLVVGGCRLFDRKDKPVIDPVQKYLLAEDQTLPTGVVGEPYEAVVAMQGGDAPYHFVNADNKMPVGLTLSDDGHISGIPAEAGDFSFALNGSDSAGRSTRIELSVQIVLEPRSVSCGQTVSGVFPSSAFTFDGPDLTQLDSVEWLAVELPDDLTTRVELQFDMVGSSTLYVELPSEVVGSGNLDDHYVSYYLNPGYTEMNVPIDAGTIPSLSGYQSQPLLPMVLVASEYTEWSMHVECTDGPIFMVLPQYPVRLGDEMLIDYQVYGDNSDVRIFTEDPLPDWMIWDETTGTITGTALEPGGWEFTIVAETPDGRRREERSILGVYAVEDVACGQTVDLLTEEGYLDGEFYAFYDPRGFGVYRLPLVGVETSEITLEVQGSDGHYLGLASPNPDWLRFYGGAERLYLTDPLVELEVNPRSYPAVDHYLDPLVGEMYFSAGSLGSDWSMQVTVECDHGPRPNLAELPVVPQLATADFQLEALGGSPPYTWEASGLPTGLAIDADGLMHGQTGAIGAYPVELTVTDKLGASFTDDYTLYLGEDAACDGYTRVSCGDSIDGRFDEAYYNDGNGRGSTEVFCIVDDSDLGLGWEIFSDKGELRVDVADPGRSADEMFDQDLGTYVEWVEFDSSVGVPVDTFSWPDIDDYQDLPVLLAIRAYDPGGWTVHLTCQ